jgi:enterochelin esterase family protein
LAIFGETGPEMNLSQYEFNSRSREPRTVWIQQPQAGRPKGLCLFLDAEYFLTQVGAAPVIRRMQQDGRFPPMLTAYVSSHAESLTRWTDSFCNNAFAKYLATDLCPWLKVEFDVEPADNIVAGLSLTGLSAAHAALQYPKVFRRVLSLSGSFWWNETWLPREVASRPCSGVAFRLTVGIEESKENTTHMNCGQELVQMESQLHSNRKMRDALIATGHSVSYREFPGRHDYLSWRAELEESLIASLTLPIK